MDQYPRFSFRLSPEILRKVDLLARIRGRTRSQVVREAVEFYFSVKFRTGDIPDRP